MKSSLSKIIAVIALFNLGFLSLPLGEGWGGAFAQTIPGAVNFQAIARDAGGAVLMNTAIQVRVSILDGSSSGAVLGSYTYQKTTDSRGQFTVAIGTDATIANSGAALSAINWTAASRFIKVEYQPGTSGGFTLVSNSEATASFYAFAAKTAAGLSISGSNGDVLKHNGSTWVAGSAVESASFEEKYLYANQASYSFGGINSIQKGAWVGLASGTTYIPLTTVTSSAGGNISNAGGQITLSPGRYAIHGFTSNQVVMDNQQQCAFKCRIIDANNSNAILTEGSTDKEIPYLPSIASNNGIYKLMMSTIDDIIVVPSNGSILKFQRYTYGSSNTGVQSLGISDWNYPEDVILSKLVIEKIE